MDTSRSATRVTAVVACAACAGGLDHCHGTLVIHHDGLSECTEHGCGPADPARHALVIECAELADCGCVPETETALAVAS